jgi:hypothetical protein
MSVGGLQLRLFWRRHNRKVRGCFFWELDVGFFFLLVPVLFCFFFLPFFLYFFLSFVLNHCAFCFIAFLCYLNRFRSLGIEARRRAFQHKRCQSNQPVIHSINQFHPHISFLGHPPNAKLLIIAGNCIAHKQRLGGELAATNRTFFVLNTRIEQTQSWRVHCWLVSEIYYLLLLLLLLFINSSIFFIIILFGSEEMQCAVLKSFVDLFDFHDLALDDSMR